MKTMSHYQILKGRAKDLDGILICLRMAFEISYGVNGTEGHLRGVAVSPASEQEKHVCDVRYDRTS